MDLHVYLFSLDYKIKPRFMLALMNVTDAVNWDQLNTEQSLHILDNSWNFHFEICCYVNDIK